MAAPVLNTEALIAAVDRATTLQNSAVAFIEGSADVLKEAVRKALEDDDAADQGSIDAAMAAVDAKVAEMTAASDRLAPALESTGGGGTGDGGGTPEARRR